MKIPVPQILPLRNIGNALWNIFRPESGIKISHPLQPENIQAEDLEKVIEKEKKGYKNHEGDLQFQEPVKGFLYISARSKPAERIE